MASSSSSSSPLPPTSSPTPPPPPPTSSTSPPPHLQPQSRFYENQSTSASSSSSPNLGPSPHHLSAASPQPSSSSGNTPPSASPSPPSSASFSSPSASMSASSAPSPQDGATLSYVGAATSAAAAAASAAAAAASYSVSSTLSAVGAIAGAVGVSTSILAQPAGQADPTVGRPIPSSSVDSGGPRTTPPSFLENSATSSSAVTLVGGDDEPTSSTQKLAITAPAIPLGLSTAGASSAPSSPSLSGRLPPPSRFPSDLAPPNVPILRLVDDEFDRSAGKVGKRVEALEDYDGTTDEFYDDEDDGHTKGVYSDDGLLRPSAALSRRRGDSQGDSAEGSEDVTDEIDEDLHGGRKLSESQKLKVFHKIFRSLPPDEPLIKDHICAYPREMILQQGKIYLSPNFFCFFANILGFQTKIIIPIDDIVSLKKAKTAMIIPNAIQITTNEKTYFFTSFISRELAFNTMEQLHRRRILQRGLASSLKTFRKPSDASSTDFSGGGVRRTQSARRPNAYGGSNSLGTSRKGSGLSAVTTSSLVNDSRAPSSPSTPQSPGGWTSAGVSRRAPRRNKESASPGDLILPSSPSGWKSSSAATLITEDGNNPSHSLSDTEGVDARIGRIKSHKGSLRGAGRAFSSPSRSDPAAGFVSDGALPNHNAQSSQGAGSPVAGKKADVASSSNPSNRAMSDLVNVLSPIVSPILDFFSPPSARNSQSQQSEGVTSRVTRRSRSNLGMDYDQASHPMLASSADALFGARDGNGVAVVGVLLAFSVVLCLILAIGSSLVLWRIRTIILRLESIAFVASAGEPVL
ncbi:hypothetical protein DFJ73DRAFT_383455 [Zopfochytrium polystomum]|nr:hypothetical protein DFJ73DRAFT_383455 [Zopfochytrium polystomum]